MIHRLRVVLPSDSVVLGVVLAFALAEGPFIFLEWKIQQPIDIPRPGLFVVRFIAVFYGCWRFTNFYPATQPAYLAWLERSPWRAGKALPGGPIHLVWEDLLPLSGLAVMGAFLGPLIPYQCLALFLVGYLISLSSSSFRNGTKAFGYLGLFGVGLAIRFWPEPKVMLAILAAFYLVGMVGLHVALKKFPWPFFTEARSTQELQKGQVDSCGWPFDQLKPPLKPGRLVSKGDGLMIGLMTGWYLFAAESLWSNPADQLFLVQKGFTIGVGILASVRTILYCSGYAPPISLLGRIRTFHWIIPGYDKVFLGPICTILVGLLAFDRFRPAGLDDLNFLPFALAIAIVVTLDTGPSLSTWRLTGQHRMTVSGSKMGGEYVKVG